MRTSCSSILKVKTWHSSYRALKNHSFLPSQATRPIHSPSSILNKRSLQPLRIFHIHRLHIAIQLLLRILLIIPLSRDANSQSIRHALDPRLPNLLVQLWVESNIVSALLISFPTNQSPSHPQSKIIGERKTQSRYERLTIAFSANFRISLIALGALFLNDTPCT